MIKMIACTLINVIFLCSSVYAVDWGANIKWAGFSGGNQIRQGGVNQLDDLKAQNENDCYNLENYLSVSNYILITSDSKEISDDDYDLIFPYLPYTNLIKNDNFLWNKYKLYVYSPSYNEAINKLRNNDTVPEITQQELKISSVMVDYFTWFQAERFGQIVNEYNDFIPDWYSKTGFILINSPISITITLELVYEKTLYQLHLTENEPLLVKMKAGVYSIININNINIYNGTVDILTSHTENNPFVLNLAEIEENYKISSEKNEDTGNWNWGDTESVIVNNNENNSRKSIVFWVAFIFCSLIGITCLIMHFIKKIMEN